MAGSAERYSLDSDLTEAEIFKLLLRETSDDQPDWLWQTTAGRRVVNPTQSFADAIGITRENLAGMPILQVFAGSSWETGNFDPSLHHIADIINARIPIRDVLLNIALNGERRWWEISANPRFDIGAKFSGYFGVASDVTEARASTDRINRMARYDIVTGLPNRFLISEALSRSCEEAERIEGKSAIAISGITNLNEIKSHVGYRSAEEMLMRIARELAHFATDNCIVGQISPAEFALVWRDSRSENVVQRELKAFCDIIRSVSNSFRGAVVATGRASYPEDATDSNDLISAALEQIYPPLIGTAAYYRQQLQGSIYQPNTEDAAGIVSESELRAIVLHGPQADAGLDALIIEHRQRLHNGPPEALNQSELEKLEELSQELKSLLILAGEGAPVRKKRNTVASLTSRVFQFSQDTGELFVAGLKPFLASAPLAVGTLVILQAVCTPAVGSILAPGAALAVLAGHYGYDVKRSKEKNDKPIQ